MEAASTPSRFRYRIIPVTLLLIFGSLSTLAIGGYVVFTACAEINARWLKPDPFDLEFLHDRPLSPPIIAAFSMWAIAAYFEFRAAVAWLRGNWKQAIRRTIAIAALLAIGFYVGNFQ